MTTEQIELAICAFLVISWLASVLWVYNLGIREGRKQGEELVKDCLDEMRGSDEV